MFEDMDAVGEGVGGIVGTNFATCLEDDFTSVYFFVDMVYGYATFGVAGGKYSLMYVVSIHAGTSMFGE